MSNSRPRIFNAQTRRVIYMLALTIVSFSLMATLTRCDSDDDETPPATNTPPAMTSEKIASGFQGASGSTVGPDGNLYITEGAIGKISSVNPTTGTSTTFAEGFPPLNPDVGIGGVYDISFLNDNAYALVTLVSSDVGGADIDGIYRIDGPDSATAIADIGTFNMANPPTTAFYVPTGVQFAMQPYNNGFLVTDGHFNRVYYVELDGTINILQSLGNVVPTGLELDGNTIYFSELGPSPNIPEDGRVLSFEGTADPVVVASGASMMIDVEYSEDHTLYAIAQGDWDGQQDGSPGLPNTGSLVKVNDDGTVTVIKDQLDRPTSLEFIGNTAYVVTLTGEVWKIDNI